MAICGRGDGTAHGGRAGRGGAHVVGAWEVSAGPGACSGACGGETGGVGGVAWLAATGEADTVVGWGGDPGERGAEGVGGAVHVVVGSAWPGGELGADWLGASGEEGAGEDPGGDWGSDGCEICGARRPGWITAPGSSAAGGRGEDCVASAEE